MPAIKSDYSKMSLKRLQEIRANGYRNKQASREYEKHEIDFWINKRIENASMTNERKRIAEMWQYEREKLALKRFIKTIRLNGRKYLSNETMDAIVKELSHHVGDFI